MKKISNVFISTILLFTIFSSSVGGVFALESEIPEPKYEMRATWISTVTNIDLKPGMGEEEYRDWVKSTIQTLESKNFNTIIFQVKPTSDALYPSELAPWSRYITGQEQGTDPGYDPLGIMLEEAHAHGLELHAWINPYRVTMPSDTLEDLAENNIAIQHPEWVVKHGSQYYLDPGIPGVQDYLVETVKELVENYDVDSVHMDDYFYPGPEFDDEETYEEYGGDFDEIGDWRRDNVNQLVFNINNAIKDIRPWVQFGISPSGIWRNIADDPTGSDTNGNAHYDNLFADSRQWIIDGSIDYITPQIYWSRTLAIASYTVLMKWWSNQVIEYANNHPVNLYIGMADYKVNNNFDDAWENVRELPEQILDNREHGGPNGQMHFTLRDILANELGYQDLVQEEAYYYKSLTPTHSWNGADLPNPPTNVTLQEVEDGIDISIETINTDARKYVVYRFENDAEIDYTDPKNILKILYHQDTVSFLDTEVNPNEAYTYGVTSISNTGIESEEATEANWPIVEVVDKEKLATVIATAEEKNEADYTAESWSVLIKALENAKEIFEDEQATQDDVNQGLADLEKALSELVFAEIEVDKSELEKLILHASELDETDYTTESWRRFVDVLDHAIAILGNKEATEEEVAEAIAQLATAIEQLEKEDKEIVDTSKLQALINKVEEKSQKDYTAESWGHLAKVLTDAKAILANETATQNEIDTIVSELIAAINGLVKISDVKGNGKGKGTDEYTGKDGQKLPKTATNNFTLLLVGSLIIMGGSFVYFIGKRKPRNKLIK